MKHEISTIYLKYANTTKHIKRILRSDENGLYVIFNGRKTRVESYHGTHYALMYETN